ncbi:uncharacterized protein LOC110116363 [Dendrobium catenatum]|uniref:Uncharacterized protein n=1 Tax=Dendrobium catenatum TaxID=906689 RepID=A0A2I0V8Y5_9ASPA|nr:uncharacterized protein LOC110116363 [Dendrobium catenatum]PKU59876.1 hypothetical protein MA16_Dca028204 [Dendrobium catenatum]
MEAKLILSPFPSKLHFPSPCPRIPRQPSILCSTLSPNNNSQDSSSSSSSNGKTKETQSPTTLNIRYRARSKRQQAKQEKQKQEEKNLQKEPKPAKKWEEMRLSEKALELYLGEKGVLFWLNKLAYASIFVVIGAWILFRFVGPSLGLYQLDSSPLSPSSIFKDG